MEDDGYNGFYMLLLAFNSSYRRGEDETSLAAASVDHLGGLGEEGWHHDGVSTEIEAQGWRGYRT